MPFGFSVGDFVASIQLIHKAAKALRSTSGATEQYQQALLDLELIETVLRRVQGLSPASASHETIQAIQLCALACHAPLAHFLQKVRELEPHLNFSGKSSPANFLHIKKGGHKLRWAILLEQDVAKLKASIGPGIEIINTLLQIESLERGAITQQSLDRITEQVGRVLPAVDKVATFLQSNITTVNHMQNLPTLAHLKNELARNATSQQMQTLASAIADLSVRLNNTATKDQANGLAKLVEDNKTQQSSGVAALSSLAAHNIQELTELKRITESSNRMLATLLHQIPPVSGSVAHGSPGMATLDDSNRLQGSSGIRFSRPTSPVAVWQALLKALRRALDGLLLFFLWLAPAFQLYLRTLNTMSRSPKMLLDSNITFVDVLNREFSLQYQQFRYWPVMSAFLQCQFRGCPGALRITHKRFAVFKEMRSTGRGAMIPFEEWEHIVRPGQRVLMSMYIGHDDSTQGQWRARNVCPSCGFDEPQPHTCDDSIWKKW